MHAEVVPPVDLSLQFQPVDLNDHLAGFGAKPFSGDVDHVASGGRGHVCGKTCRVNGKDVAAGQYDAVVFLKRLVHIPMGVDKDVQEPERDLSFFGISIQGVGLERKSDVDRLDGSGIDLVDLNARLWDVPTGFPVVGGQQHHVEVVTDLLVTVVAEPDPVTGAKFLVGVPGVNKPDGQELKVSSVVSGGSHVDPCPTGNNRQTDPGRVAPDHPRATGAAHQRSAKHGPWVADRKAGVPPAPGDPRAPAGHPGVCGVAGRPGVPAAEMEVDECAVDVSVETPGVPSTVAVERTRQAESACHVATTRHFELSSKIEFTPDPCVGESSQLPGFQAVCEIGATARQADFSSRFTKLSISLNRGPGGGT